MKKKREYIDDEVNDGFEDENVPVSFRVLKGKPNRNPDQFKLWFKKDVCSDVQYKGRSHLRIRCSSPAEFKNMCDFMKQFIGDFPSESPYIYIPKDVLVQQPKRPGKKKSLFKDC